LAAYALAFLVTVAFSVLLNNDLAATADAATAREQFEDPWVAWNVVRAVLSTVALGCLARGLIRYGRSRREAVPGPGSSSGPDTLGPSGA
jgi:hypothetical protein